MNHVLVAIARPTGLSDLDATASAAIGKRRRRIMRCHEVQGVAVPAMDISELGVADADGILQHSCKHRLKIAGRAADNLEHFRSGCLLLQRLR